MKQDVLWGAGKNGREFLEKFNEFMPQFIIDSDMQKRDSTLKTYTVRHPFYIDSWSNLFIVIAVDKCDDIVHFLNGKGLYHGRDYVFYSEFSEPSVWEKMTISDIENELAVLLNDIDNANLKERKNLLFSHFLYDSPMREMTSFWNRVNGKGMPIVLFWDEYRFVRANVISKTEFPVIKLPRVFRNCEYFARSFSDENIPDHMILYVNEREYLKWVADNIRLRYIDIKKDVEYVIAFYADYMINKILDILAPERVYIFNIFRTWHYALKAICDARHITVGCFEFGPIEGTFYIDYNGMMGESTPCINAAEFNKKPITSADLENARKVLDYIYISKINRYRQPDKSVEEFCVNTCAAHKPVVLFAGQNDYEGGLQPWTENCKKKHSPIFSDSMEAAIYLWQLCKTLNLNFLYKPHPSMEMRADKYHLWPENMPVLKRMDINKAIDCSDVVITMLSSSAYIAIIHKKPVIILGYSQLSHNNACYEIYDKAMIKDALVNALEAGYTREQENRFIAHVSRMLKYYLYDTLIPRGLSYGRDDVEI